MAKKKIVERAMSDEHKQALAAGREQGRIVRVYLEALETNKPRRGRRRTAESIAARLEHIESLLEDSEPLARLHLLQERMNLRYELEIMEDTFDIGDLEKAFISVAKEYSERKGLTHSVWREFGVSASVLREAGV